MRVMYLGQCPAKDELFKQLKPFSPLLQTTDDLADARLVVIFYDAACATNREVLAAVHRAHLAGLIRVIPVRAAPTAWCPSWLECMQWVPHTEFLSQMTPPMREAAMADLAKKEIRPLLAQPLNQGIAPQVALGTLTREKGPLYADCWEKGQGLISLHEDRHLICDLADYVEGSMRVLPQETMDFLLVSYLPSLCLGKYHRYKRLAEQAMQVPGIADQAGHRADLLIRYSIMASFLWRDAEAVESMRRFDNEPAAVRRTPMRRSLRRFAESLQQAHHPDARTPHWFKQVICSARSDPPWMRNGLRGWWGISLARTHKFTDARRVLEVALAEADACRDLRTQVFIIGPLLAVLRELGDLDAAEALLSQARPLLVHGEQPNVTWVLRERGLLHRQRRSLAPARRWLSRAHERFAACKMEMEAADCQRLLAAIC